MQLCGSLPAPKRSGVLRERDVLLATEISFKVSSGMAINLPPSATAGQLAKVVGVTERSIFARKADGRLPVLPDGKIDLSCLIRAGVAAMARSRSNPEASTDLGAAETFDIGLRTAASVTAHIIVRRMVAAGPGADIGIVAAEALAEALNMAGIAVGDIAPPARIETFIA